MTVPISIIIPTLNEEKMLGKTLARLQQRKDCEIIVVDGGSNDATLVIAREARCKVLSCDKGRARQMNFGAAKATGKVFLFLHGDTLLPDDFPNPILEALQQPDVAAGAFSLAIEGSSKSLATMAFLANLRSRFLHLPYGDQALFTHRNMFYALGGFPEIEIMEDFVFVRKMKKKGKIIILPERATTSARRWHNMGIVRTTMINQLMVGGYYLGIPPAILVRWYRRINGIGGSVK